jgi:RNA recognition motif-containing protein
MSFTVFLGNIPTWVTADDIRSWLNAEGLVSDSIKVIRNPETQESKGFAFIEAPNAEEMQSIIRRFDRAPLEDRLLRANPAQPPKSRREAGPPVPAGVGVAVAGITGAGTVAAAAGQGPVGQSQRPALHTERRRGGKKHKKPTRDQHQGPPSAFAEELAKAL